MKSYFDCGLFDLMIGNEKIFGMFDPAHIQKFNERKICTAVEQLADVILTEVKRFGNIMQAEVTVGMIVQDVIQDRSHLLMRGVISLHFMRRGQRLIHAEKKRIEFVCAVMSADIRHCVFLSRMKRGAEQCIQLFIQPEDHTVYGLCIIARQCICHGTKSGSHLTFIHHQEVRKDDPCQPV